MNFYIKLHLYFLHLNNVAIPWGMVILKSLFLHFLKLCKFQNFTRILVVFVIFNAPFSPEPALNLMKLLDLHEIGIIFSNFMYFFSTQALFRLVMSKHLHELFNIFSNSMYFSLHKHFSSS